MTIASTLVQRFNMIFMEDLNLTELYLMRDQAQRIHDELNTEAADAASIHPEYAADLFVEAGLYTRMIIKINVELKAREMHRAYDERKSRRRVVRIWRLLEALFSKKSYI